MNYLSGLRADWEIVPFSKIVASSEYGLSLATDAAGKTPILKMNSLSDGRVLFDDLDHVTCSEEERRTYALKRGDILFNRTNSFDLVGKTAVIREDSETIFASYLVRFRVKQSADPRFVGYWFSSSRAQSRFKQLATPGVSQSNINPTSLRKDMSLPLPSFPEQQKIADILGTWDETLEKLDALIVAKERRKQALMQQLLSGKHQLPNRSSHWTKRTLGDLVEPIVRPTQKPATAFLAAGIRSHGRGVFLKPAFEPAAIALDELFEIKKDDLIVNITFAWEGAVAIVPAEADGALVSHRFPIFRVRESEAALSFLRHYVLTKRFVFDCGLASPGGAGRNRVLSKRDFLKIALWVPAATEQQEIGSILDDIDTELLLLRDQRAAFDQQKRGLMQQLLTGKRRVTLDSQTET